MKRIKGVFCLILISMLWVSCTDHIVYHSYHHFPKEGWRKSDTISLDILITDTVSSDVEITFLVRNQSNYPYQDFSAIVQHNMPDTAQRRSFKLDFVMADKGGKWNGNGWGGLYESSVSLGKHYVSPGTYTFKVIQHTADEHLKGINDIGILIKKDKLATE